MSDLREAAERIRKAMEYGCYVGLPGQLEADHKLLAQMYLAEHPAADDTPIDEQWLREMGFGPIKPTRCSLSVLKVQSEMLGKCEMRLQFALESKVLYLSVRNELDAMGTDDGDLASIALPVTTRGQLRKLLSALGIGKETT